MKLIYSDYPIGETSVGDFMIAKKYDIPEEDQKKILEAFKEEHGTEMQKMKDTVREHRRLILENKERLTHLKAEFETFVDKNFPEYKL